LIGDPLWATFVEEWANGRFQAQFAILQQLTEADIPDLVSLLADGASHQQRAALRILYELGIQDDRRLGAEMERHMGPALRTMIESAYPATDTARSTMFLWLRVDRESAADFLNAWVDGTDVADADADVASVALHLSFGTTASCARLRRLAEARPHVQFKGNAALVLERTAPDWPERLAAYGRAWRERRDCPGLLYLVNHLVDRRPREDAQLADVIAVMGEPDERGERHATYYARSGEQIIGYLYLETEAHGTVTGWKLDNC
jgi:hypothetical protein